MDKDGKIQIDGLELAYSVEGEGTPVLVIGSRIYYPRLFSKGIREQLQLIFIDHRGFVESPQALQPQDYSLDHIVDDIETIREQLGLKSLVVLGHSGHAFVALEYAKKYPAYVQKIVLLNTAPTNSQERQRLSFADFDQTASMERKTKFEQDIALLASDIEKEPERRFAHLLIRMGAQSFYDYTFDAASMWDGICTNMPVIDHLWGEAFARINLIERLAGIDKPVFIGLGRYDYLVAPVSLWDSVESTYSNVTKVIFERSGHNPMLEESQLFDSTLIKWIQLPPK